MKKFIKILLIPFLFLASSCKKEENKQEKFILEGQYNLTQTIKIEREQLDQKMDSNESFVFYANNDMCNSCEYFKTYALIPFIEESQSIIYEVDYRQVLTSNYSKKFNLEVTPTVYVINKGNVVTKQEFSSQKEMFKSKEGLKATLAKYMHMPSIIYVTEQDIETKIAFNDTFILVFGDKMCGDCKNLRSRVLDSYMPKANNKKIYYFDRYGMDSDAWKTLAAKYNLTVFRNGRVPTLQFYENGVTSNEKMAVYLNDAIDADTNTITESWYPELVNQQKTTEELLQFHDAKIIEYLDKYLPLC